jgi:hypothetical protein
MNNKEIDFEIIRKLDALLYEGYLLKTRTVDDWAVKNTSVNKPNLEVYKQDFESQINAWLIKVATLLTTQFNEKHLYFHFIHPKSNALSNTHPLGRLILAIERHLFALEEVILWLDEQRNLSLRRDIAEIEHNADILYKITFSDHTREIKLNNIILAKPDFGSENDLCFQFIFANAGRPLNIDEISDGIGERPKKRFVHIVRDLGFSGDVQKVFFPVLTKTQIMFINPITKQYFYDKNLPTINFRKIVSQSKPE